jgi:signal transduction histidine kinase
MKWYWLAILIPFFLSIGVGLFLNYASDQNPILYARADLGTAFVICGFILTLLLAVILAFHDIRDYAKRAQIDLLIQASEDHRRFLQRLDHELKNPLTAIMAGLVNLKETNKGNGNQDTFKSVENEVHRLSRLVSDLRKLSELETRPIERTIVNLTEIIDDVLSLSKEQSDAVSREFIVSIPRAPWPLPEISADRDLIFLALYNLLSNAVKFTRPGDTIEIRAYEDNQNIVIEVADTGPGIPSEELPHVWEELYRGIGARGIPGSGLGLALVKAIVNKHNGEISIRSRQSQGTVISLHFPNN